MPSRRLALALALATALLASLAGCSSDNNRSFNDPLPMGIANADVAIAPKQLVQIASDVVKSEPYSLPIESNQKGQIATGWREYPGEWHIARRWVERSRFRITVLPDFDEPTARSHLQVIADTQESIPTEPRQWHDNPSLQRADRARDLINAIRQRAQSGGGGAPASAPTQAK
jgi:hypothetical protein